MPNTRLSNFFHSVKISKSYFSVKNKDIPPEFNNVKECRASNAQMERYGCVNSGSARYKTVNVPNVHLKFSSKLHMTSGHQSNGTLVIHVNRNLLHVC